MIKCKSSKRSKGTPTRRILYFIIHGPKRTWHRFFVHRQFRIVSLSQLRQEPVELKNLAEVESGDEEMWVENYTAHIDNHRCDCKHEGTELYKKWEVSRQDSNGKGESKDFGERY